MMTLLIGGCHSLTTKGVPFQEAEKPTLNSNLSTVYVYRVGEGNAMEIGGVKIDIDDSSIFNVVDHGFTWFYIEPGLHEIKASWSWLEKPMFEEGHFDEKRLSIKFQAGKTYYINYKIVQDRKPDTYMETTSLAGKALSDTHIQSVKLVNEKEDIAIHKLRASKYQSNGLK